MERSLEAVLNSKVCPVCGGSGWELYRKRVDGYETALEFAGPCRRCKTERRLQDITGVPPQFRYADLSKFGFDSYSRDMGNLRLIAEDFLMNYQRWKNSGKGLYLWSKTPGSGKTYLACCLAKSVMIKYDLQMRFITATDYLSEIAESYKLQRGEFDKSAVYLECDLLVFDDVGAQKTGEWQTQELFKILNERLNTGKIIIFTSNMCPEDLNLDDRTISRVVDKSIVLQMPEESIREKKARKEQDKFLEDILHTHSGK